MASDLFQAKSAPSQTTPSQELDSQNSADSQSFEELLESTREVLNQLNSQDISLKDSLALYKQGATMLFQAQKLLESAKLEYETLQNPTKSSS
ncbi:MULTISPECIES: exodeoxyribonuclease VII small subunit [unclassified Helicobacter]|uniref:exodeoxyribonuclease VII small subunit n=1 Tax=unclassified Helicobacter TaxID=2593540 RepID=UPI0015F1300C|nr:MULTISPECIES: exodeoxyribonuclease VII small subunit [unclassified Helicobacter]